jgi:ABC-type sugar transport system ATPase subunit
MTGTALLRIQGLHKRFGAVTALSEVSLEVREGEFFSLVGPTNAGKSTLLKTIAGLHRADAGGIALRGAPIDALPPHERRVSLVFQQDALFPDRTGYDNIAFALEAAKTPAAQIEDRVREVAQQLGIAHVLHRHPDTFSGGERKRVAIARALAAPSDLLMLDEPLGSLDARLRVSLRLELKQLQSASGRSILFVTHGHVEAMSLSDRIAVIDVGRIQQIGTPDEIYRTPANRFVATFFGSPPMNLMQAELIDSGGTRELVGSGFRVPAPALDTAAAPPRELDVGVPAERVRIGGNRSDSTPFPAKVLWIERLGARQVLELELGEDTLKAVLPHDHPVRDSREVWVGFSPRAEHLLDRATGLFIR